LNLCEMKVKKSEIIVGGENELSFKYYHSVFHGFVGTPVSRRMSQKYLISKQS